MIGQAVHKLYFFANAVEHIGSNSVEIIYAIHKLTE